MGNDSDQYVLFELAGATYAVSSASVLHIDMLEHVTTVPNTHQAIDGVVFSRGQVIPALNLRARFGFSRQERTMRTRIIFAKLQQRTVGLIVDSAREFKRIPASQVRPIDQELAGIAGAYLRGLTTINERLVLMIDLPAVVNLDQDEALADSISNLIAQGTAESTAAATAH